MPEMRAILEYTIEGVYFNLKNPISNSAKVREFILKTLDEKAIPGVKPEAVEGLVNGLGDVRREKISDIAMLDSVHEGISLEVSADALQGYIFFTPPVMGGDYLTLEDISKFFIDKGIVYGVDEKVIADIANGRSYNKDYLVATGRAPIHGTDGTLEYLFDISDKKMKPVILEDGSVDYYNVENFAMAQAGQVLVKMTPATNGADGMNIFGKSIIARNGIPGKRVRRGVGVRFSEDGTELIADVNGQIVKNGDRISVSQVLEIYSDVGPETGNIDFVGSVKVRGNLRNEYAIAAVGNVEISGTGDGEYITAGGNVVVTGGISGANKTVIRAEGSVTARFIAHSDIIVGGNIFTDSIVRCNIRSKGAVEIQGKRGVISGGVVYALDGVSANTIGSPMAAATEICVGLDYEVYEKYLSLKTEMEKLVLKYNETQKNINYIQKQALNERLPDDKRKSLLSLEVANKHLLGNINAIKAEITTYLNKLNTDRYHGYVKVTGTLYTGVKIQIGNAVMLTRDEIYSSMLVNQRGAIVITPL